MRLEQNIWIIKSARNIEQLVRDFACTGELTPGSMKQPQPREWRRQVDRVFKLSR
jgi:hypothetical protein